MLTLSLQDIRSEINSLLTQEKGVRQPPNDYADLLNLVEQMNLLESQLSKAYKEGGLTAASRIIVRPAQPNCQICGRAIIQDTL